MSRTRLSTPASHRARLLIVPAGILILLFSSLLGFGAAPAGATSIQVDQLSLNVLAPTAVDCRGEVDVSLTITGQTVFQPGTPVDLMFVLDGSGSVSAANWSNLKAAVGDAINNLPLSTTKVMVGIVQFSGARNITDDRVARVEYPLSTSKSSLTSALSGMQQMVGQTDTYLGIKVTETYLSTYGRANAMKVIVTITDGDWNLANGVDIGFPDIDPVKDTTPELLADVQARPNWYMYGVGFGQISQSGQQRVNLLASDPDSNFAYSLTDLSQLASTLRDITNDVSLPAGRQLQLEVRPDIAFTLVNGSVTATRGTVVPLSPSQINWQLQELGNETVTISYKLRHNGGSQGTQQLHQSPQTRLTWHNSQGVQTTSVLPSTAITVNSCDAVAPTTTATVSGTEGSDGWLTDLDSVVLNAADNTGGRGVQSITWSASGANTIATTTVTNNSSAPVASVKLTATNLPNDGITTVTYFATDRNGNAEAARTLEIKVDGSAPTSSATPDRSANANGWYNAPINITFSGVDSASGGVICDPPTTYDGVDGEDITLSGACVDAAGNSASASFTFDYDATAPEASATPSRTPDSNGWYTAPVTVSFAGTDALSGNVTCDPAITYASPDSATASVAGTCTDAAGNTATASLSFGYDATAPAFPSLDDVTVEATGPAGGVVTYTPPTATDAVADSPEATCAPASGSTFAIGSTEVTCSTSDAAGNVGSGSFTVSVVDTTGPEFTTVDDIRMEATSAAGAVVSFTTPTATDLVDGVVAVNCDRSSGTTFSLGTSLVTCTAKDTRNNVGSTTFTVLVEDTTAPVIAPMSNVSVPYAGGSGAIVSYTAPATTDAVDGTSQASCVPASGTLFPLGTTTVTCTAADAAGNSAEATTFTVSVGYEWSGFLAPFDSSKAIKANSTLPLKFRLTGASANLTTLAPKVYVAPVVGSVVGTEQPASSSNGATTFEYKDGQYQFNWKTMDLAPGTYQLRLDLGDGVSHTVQVTLR